MKEEKEDEEEEAEGMSEKEEKTEKEKKTRRDLRLGTREPKSPVITVPAFLIILFIFF